MEQNAHAPSTGTDGSPTGQTGKQGKSGCNFRHAVTFLPQQRARSHLTDISVRQTPGYKNSLPHSAYGHITTPIYQRPFANTELFIVDSLTVTCA